jgi:iron complex outermembrane recepter protein
MKYQNKATLRRNLLAQSLVMAIGLPFALTAFAQNAGADEDAKKKEAATDAKEIESVTVVGSRIKRSEMEGAAPVTIISRADIEREGFQTVGDALQTLSQNTTSSFTGDLGVTGFSPNAQVVNLRNLGPQYTLTLINGRRPAQYPQPYNRDNNVVNVRAIPSAMVERIEVLSGGASAIYGSDAVAGVVNVVLRENFDGQELFGEVGSTTDGGGDRLDLQYVTGGQGDRWSAVGGVQYKVNEAVFASQREFLADTRNGPLGRGINPATGLLYTNPALSLIAIRRNGPQVNQNAFFPGQAICDQYNYTTVTTPVRGTYCGSFNQPASRTILNESQSFSGYGYGTFTVNDSIELFGSASFYTSEAKAGSGTEFWGTAGDQFTRTRGNSQTSAYYDPQFGSLIQLQRVFNPFELGGAEAATSQFDETTYEVLFGVRGSFAERFDWEASASYGAYDYKQDRPRLLAQSVHDYFLGPLLGYVTATGAASTAAGAFPSYRLNTARWAAPFTSEQYQAVATRVINEADTTSTTLNFNVAGDLFELPAGPVGFAGTLEAIRQTVDLRSDPRTNQIRPLDSQTIYNLTSSGTTLGKRNLYALGFETRIPLFTQLTANFAGRYDKYDDITAVDDALSYQLGLEWRPLDSLLVRTSFATGFRAPDMQLVFAQGAASFSGVTDEYACRSGVGLGLTTGPRTNGQCAAVVNDPTRYTTQSVIAGNPLLEEETSKSLTTGFVWDIMDGMSLNVDYYRIKLDDAATSLSAGYILSNEANCRLGVRADGTPFEFALSSAFCQNIIGLVTRQVAPGTALDGQISRLNTAYINAALQDISGIDAKYAYRWETDRIGKFGVSMEYNLTLTNKYKENADDDLIDYRDRLDFDNSQRSRIRGSVSWAYNDWTTTVFGTRIGTNSNSAQADFTNIAGGFSPRRLPPYILYNLTVGKRISDSVNMQLDVVNVLNNQYREDNSATGYPFYNPFIGGDPLGRRWNLSVSYKF